VKPAYNYWVDMVMGITALILALSSFLLWVVLPQGYFLSRLIWLDIHRWSGLAVTLAAALHLVLHWRWLWSMTRRHFGGGSSRAPAAARGAPDLPTRP